jgi:hypothetical protein
VQDDFIANQTTDPLNPHYTKRLYVSSASGTSTVRVTGTGSGSYTLEFSLKTTAGDSVYKKIVADTAKGMVDVYLINSETGEVALLPVDVVLFKEIIDATVSSPTNNKFFKKLADKLLSALQKGEREDVIEMIREFRTQLKAKKIQSPALGLVLKRIEQQTLVRLHEHEEKEEEEKDS